VRAEPAAASLAPPRREAGLSLVAQARSGALGLAVPREHGGQGGRLADLFHHVTDLARLSLPDAVVFAVQRQFIEVLMAARNAALREYRLPALLEASISGACGASWGAWAEAVPLAGRDTGRGWRLEGELRATPNVGRDGFLLGAPLRFGAGGPAALVLLSSDQDGIGRQAEDLPGFEGLQRARVPVTGVHFREDEILDDDGPALARAVAGVTAVLRGALAAGLARAAIARIADTPLRLQQAEALRATIRPLEGLLDMRLPLTPAAEDERAGLLARLVAAARHAVRLQGGDEEGSRRRALQAQGLGSL
jgi:alkylation response protein AidB-like acyl-CoA dehydrogenase